MRILPIRGVSKQQPAYRLLESDVLDGIRIAETSESGTVPELTVENTMDVRVYLMDGQELRGAKQNRILNTDVLVPPQTKLKIPVSCVEQGRWGYARPDFVPGKSASYRTRRGKAARVHDALKQSGRHDADQAQVWQEVAEELQQADTASATSALSDAYAVREKDLVDFRATVRLPDEAVGLAFFHGAQFMGLDLFDRHSTLAYFWESLLDSYALTWLHTNQPLAEGASLPDTSRVTEILHCAAAGLWESFRSPGEGEDYRLDDGGYAASALVWEEQAALHVQIFPNDGCDPQRSHDGESRRRPRIRRRYIPRPDGLGE